MRLFWICAAGAAGTGARYLLTLWSTSRFGSMLPYGTAIVNITGCFAISLLMHAALTNAWSDTARLTVVTGVLGGFTTYSAFNYETLRLFEQGMVVAAFGNIAVTLLGGLAGGWLGLMTGKLVLGR
jgi:CrcB protein